MTRTEDTNISQVADEGDISYFNSIVLNYKGYSDDDAGVLFCPVDTIRQDDKEKYSDLGEMEVFVKNIADLPDL